MDDQVLENISVLPPHKYPIWVKLFGVCIIIATVYSLILLPKYLVAAKKMRAAEAAYKRGDYEQSIEFYSSILETVPTSKAARIGAAEVVFSDAYKNNDELGLTLLQGITLDENDWARVTKVIPAEYRQYFGDVKQ